MDDRHAGGRPSSARPARRKSPCPERPAVGRLARLGDRIARVCTARDKLYERALPSLGEIQVKVEAAERMVARGEQRLAVVTAAHTARLQAYARRTQQDQAAGRQRANGRLRGSPARWSGSSRGQPVGAKAKSTTESGVSPGVMSPLRSRVAIASVTRFRSMTPEVFTYGAIRVISPTAAVTSAAGWLTEPVAAPSPSREMIRQTRPATGAARKASLSLARLAAVGS